MQQCASITASTETRCTRRTKDTHCWQHAPLEKHDALYATHDLVKRAPSVAARRKMIERLERKHAAVAGWIYIYDRAKDRAHSYYKIGGTERAPHHRIREWGERDDIRMVRSFRVADVWRAERLIHLMLDDARLSRQWTPDGVVTRRKHGGECATPGDRRRAAKHAKRLKTQRRNIEWFDVDMAKIFRVVVDVKRNVNIEKYKPVLN